MSGSTTMEIGIIGLGNAGKPIAERLLKKGRRIKVYDLNRVPMEDLAKLGAVTSGSACEALGDITLIVLPSTIEVRSAALGEKGFLAALQPGSVLVDLSGTDPGYARELEKQCDERNADFLGATLHASGAPSVTIPSDRREAGCSGKVPGRFKRLLPENHLRPRAVDAEGDEDRRDHVRGNEQHHLRRSFHLANCAGHRSETLFTAPPDHRIAAIRRTRRGISKARKESWGCAQQQL
jgi:hypothetical protein